MPTEHEEIQRRLNEVPDVGGKSAVIWVPPYTQRTAELESKILEATQSPPRLSDSFETGHEESTRAAWFLGEPSTLLGDKSVVSILDLNVLALESLL